MNQTQDRNSVYDYPVWKSVAPAPAPAAKHKLSPRAKAGLAAGGVVLASAAMFAWSQYETAQTQAGVQKQQLALEQEQVQLAIEQQAAKADGQETPAQKARRQAIQACIAAAGSSYNGVADCASAYPAIDSTGALTGAQDTASSTSTNSNSSGAGLLVLGGIGVVGVAGWAKKRLARTY